MKCVRCKINKTIEFEKICENCMKELRKKFKIPYRQDIMDNARAKQLIEDYEKSH